MRRLLLLWAVIAAFGLMAGAEAPVAELTTWTYPMEFLYPGDLVCMVDGNLFIALTGADAIGLFEPYVDTLREWPVGGQPEGLAVTDRGIFFTLPRESLLGWLQPDATLTRTWAVPSGGMPRLLIDGATQGGQIRLWFNEWTTGTVGYFRIDEIPPTTQASVPTRRSLPRNLEVVACSTAVVSPVVLAPREAATVRPLVPRINGPFSEWQALGKDAYFFGLALGAAGRIWISEGEGALYALSPWNGQIATYPIQTGSYISPLCAGKDGTIWYAGSDETRSVLGALNPDSGAVAWWEIPGCEDPFALVEDPQGYLWISDRIGNAIYRFAPRTNTFQRWPTGDESGPLYLCLGIDDEIWFTLEGISGWTRLRILPVPN